MKGHGKGHPALDMYIFCETFGWTPEQYRDTDMQDISDLTIVMNAKANFEKQQAKASERKGKRRR